MPSCRRGGVKTPPYDPRERIACPANGIPFPSSVAFGDSFPQRGKPYGVSRSESLPPGGKVAPQRRPAERPPYKWMIRFPYPCRGRRPRRPANGILRHGGPIIIGPYGVRETISHVPVGRHALMPPRRGQDPALRSAENVPSSPQTSPHDAGRQRASGAVFWRSQAHSATVRRGESASYTVWW